ncbi:hypothetical protein ACWEQP_30285 [Streptomyces sp. NPDC004044]
MAVTHNAGDIAPARREQLAEDGPLEIGGHTRAVTFVRPGQALHAERWTHCGFVRDRGHAARSAPTVRPDDGSVIVRWEDGTPADTTGLKGVLAGPRYEVTTGLVVEGASPSVHSMRRRARERCATRGRSAPTSPLRERRRAMISRPVRLPLSLDPSTLQRPSAFRSVLEGRSGHEGVEIDVQREGY